MKSHAGLFLCFKFLEYIFKVYIKCDRMLCTIASFNTYLCDLKHTSSIEQTYLLCLKYNWYLLCTYLHAYKTRQSHKLAIINNFLCLPSQQIWNSKISNLSTPDQIIKSPECFFNWCSIVPHMCLLIKSIESKMSNYIWTWNTT